jgi:hypothetical protein
VCTFISTAGKIWLIPLVDECIAMLAIAYITKLEGKKKQGVCHTVALPFTCKSILDKNKKKFKSS